MKDFLNKLSSYNLFNYLFPGVLFAIVASHFTRYSFIQEDIILGVFLYYFLGMIVSRFGSLVIEPFLKWIKLVAFRPYNEFIEASQKDEKLEILSEENNTYRTLSALIFSLLLLKFYEFIESTFCVLQSFRFYIVIILLLIMFLFSYRKQTGYIAKRIHKILNDSNQ